jgi:thiol:disulfide interchange protein DsbD
MLKSKMAEEIKMKKVIMFIISIFVFSVWSYSINSSWDPDEDVIKIQIFKSYDQIHSGMDLKIALRVDILGTWHINSNVPAEDYFEATNLGIPSESSFSFSGIKYPEALSLFLEFSERPVSVFEGEIFIGGVIPIPEDIALGKHAIPLQFTYQACNDQTCLPPETLEKEITITVVDKETPVQEINTEIFAKTEKDPLRSSTS